MATHNPNLGRALVSRGYFCLHLLSPGASNIIAVIQSCLSLSSSLFASALLLPSFFCKTNTYLKAREKKAQPLFVVKRYCQLFAFDDSAWALCNFEGLL